MRRRSRGARSEDELKEEENVEGEVLGCARDGGVSARREAGEAHEAVPRTEHETEAEREEQNRRHRHDADILEQDHDGVLLSTEAALHQGEPSVHEEHEEGREEHPDAVEDRRVHARTLARPGFGIVSGRLILIESASQGSTGSRH
jgi:hypothetical protein